MAKITEISNECLNIVKQFEGFYPNPYLCPAGVPTIGYGSILYENGKKVSLDDAPISEERASELMMWELNKKAVEVDAMTTDAINQYQFDALVSFAYNCGSNALRTSTLLKRVNENPNNLTIRTAFLMWIKANGKTLKGLINRRNAEADLYFKK